MTLNERNKKIVELINHYTKLKRSYIRENILKDSEIHPYEKIRQITKIIEMLKSFNTNVVMRLEGLNDKQRLQRSLDSKRNLAQ